jgi:hypothetical protein
MRLLVNGSGALMLAWAALACGGVASGGNGDSHAGAAGAAADARVDGHAVAGTPSTPSLVASGGEPDESPRPQDGGGRPASYGGGSGLQNVPIAGAETGSAGVGDSYDGTRHDCSSPVTTELAPFVARMPEDLSVTQQLAAASQALIGSWHGVVKTPWTDPYQIVASFSYEGGYSAHCESNSDFETADSGCCRAFYYGSDQNSPFKHWALTSVNADHTVDGDLDIMFCYDNGCSAPAWQGKLRQLDYDQTGNRVRFQFWRDDGYGPLELDLERDRAK